MLPVGRGGWIMGRHKPTQITEHPRPMLSDFPQLRKVGRPFNGFRSVFVVGMRGSREDEKGCVCLCVCVVCWCCWCVCGCVCETSTQSVCVCVHTMVGGRWFWLLMLYIVVILVKAHEAPSLLARLFPELRIVPQALSGPARVVRQVYANLSVRVQTGWGVTADRSLHE